MKSKKKYKNPEMMEPKRRTILDYILLVIKGIAMGTANKVPGVSGGIVAFVAGFYEEFIYSLQKINAKAFGLLFKRGWKPFLQYINYKFLGLLVLGMVISFFTVSKVLDYFLVTSEIYVWSLFFGMIVGSIYYIAMDFHHWNRRNIAWVVLGTLVGFGINFLKPASGYDNLWFIFFCGFISVSGMTLPGLSGSFILMLIGNYTLLLVDSVNSLYDAGVSILTANWSFFDNAYNLRLLKILAVFTAGSVAGLIGLSSILSYLMKHYKNSTMALIIGFITGSLGVVWPWKTTIYKTDDFGNLLLGSNQKPIADNYERYLPDIFTMETWLAILFIIIGITIVLVLEYYGRKKQKV